MRVACPRCRRPNSACYCPALPRIETRTRVMFLQHPREAKVAVGTARMAHLSLPNSELHQGVEFDRHPAVTKAASAGEVAVLYPGERARPLAEFVTSPPKTLIVVDGTWSQARKVIKRSTLLSSLPQISFVPRAPGNYRIRKEPAEHCVSTIEAVVEVLGTLERDLPRFEPMLRAFDLMVDRQLAYVEARRGARRKRLRQRPKIVPEALGTRFADLVLVHGEANAQPLDGAIYAPELVQLVAQRPSTGERYEAFLAPRRPLAPSTAHHLQVEAEQLLNGEPVAEALERFQAFAGPSPLFGTWGHYATDLLRTEGFAAEVGFDLRRAAADAIGRSGGGAELAAKRLAGELGEALGHGRAGVRLAALLSVMKALRGAD